MYVPPVSNAVGFITVTALTDLNTRKQLGSRFNTYRNAVGTRVEDGTNNIISIRADVPKTKFVFKY